MKSPPPLKVKMWDEERQRPVFNEFFRVKSSNKIRSICRISDLDIFDTFFPKFYPFICQKFDFIFKAKARVIKYFITYRKNHLLIVLEWLNFSIIEFFFVLAGSLSLNLF